MASKSELIATIQHSPTRSFSIYKEQYDINGKVSHGVSLRKTKPIKDSPGTFREIRVDVNEEEIKLILSTFAK